MAKPRIVVVGSSNTDMIVQVERIPQPGETILGGEFCTAPGGKGANQAVAAARAGGKVTLVARVGRDNFGQEAIAGFREEDISVDYIFCDKQKPSGVALIFVAASGENSIAVASGANARLSPADVKKAKKAIATADMIITQLETPLDTVEAVAELAQAHKVPLILNPAPARQLPDTILRAVTILTPNESEVELLTGIKVENLNSCQQAA